MSRAKPFFRRHRSNKYPGWKMTVDQHGAYWRMLGQCYHAMGVTNAAEREEARQTVHFRAFGRHGVSAKEIDHMKMFDAFKAACLAIIKPDDLQAQVDQANMDRTRLIHRINELAPEIYWRAEAKRKFGHDDLSILSVDNLTMFRNHLSARTSEIVWPETVRQPANYLPVNQPVPVPAGADDNEPF
jgi:hypothetical protein